MTLNQNYPTTFAGVNLNDVVMDSTPARTSAHRNDLTLTTSTYFGFALCGDWGDLRPRNGFPTRNIARQDGAEVWLYNRRPEEQEHTDERLCFTAGAVVQFRGAPDPVDAVEVVYARDRILEKPCQ